MEIMSRKTALSLNLVKYFTGKPCIREHISERYATTGHCISCLNTPAAVVKRNEKQKIYNEANKDARKAASKLYRAKNKEIVQQRKKEWAQRNKEKIAQAAKMYREINGDRLREHDKIRCKSPERKAARAAAYRRFMDNFVGPKRPKRKHTDESLKAARAACFKAYYERNKERLLQRKKDYISSNRDSYLEGQKRWREKNISRRTALQVKREARLRKAMPIWFGELDELAWKEAADLVVIRRKATGISWHADHMIPLAGKMAAGLHVWQNCQVIPASLNNSKLNKMILTEPDEWLAHL